MTAAMLASAGAMADGDRLNSQGYFLENDAVTVDALGSAAQVGYRFTSTGAAFEDANTVETSLTDWHEDAPTPPTGAEVRLTVQSGDDPNSGPAIDTWIDLSSPFSGSREWLYTGPPVLSGVWLIEIRDSGGTVRASAEYTVTLENSGPP